MPRRQMELLYDCGIYCVEDARAYLNRMMRALGEFNGQGKAQLEAQTVAKACRKLIRCQPAQRAYAVFILDEYAAEWKEGEARREAMAG